MRSTYDDFSIAADYEENRNRSRSGFYNSSGNNSNANNNNSAIPYHARENSLPFSYGQIQNRTSTPLKNGGHGGVDLVGRTDTNYDFDLKSIAGGGGGERYGRSPERSINGGVEGVGGGMLKPQARLTSPILVRKTLNTRSPTRAGAANTNTIANTYHYNNNYSNGLNGNSRGRTPPCDDFEDLLRERRDRVYNDYYRSTLPSLPPEPPQRQRHALSSGPTTARLASTVVNGGRRSPGVNFYTGSNLNSKSGSILKSNSNLGSVAAPPSKYNFDFEFHLNLDDLPPPPASFANNNNNCNSSYTIERSQQYRTRDIPVVDLVERNYHTISSTNAFRETQQHQQQRQQQQFQPQSMSQTLKRSAYATYGNENVAGYGNTNYSNSYNNNNNNNNSYGSYNGERGASQQQRSQFERLMATRTTTTAAAAGGTVAGVDVGRNYSNISYNNNHNNSSNNNAHINGLPPSSLFAAPIYATTTKQGGGGSASTQTTTSTTMYRSGAEPEMSVTDYASLSLPLPTTAVGAAAPMVSPASPLPPLVSRPETPAFPVTPRTPFGHNGGQSSPATGAQTHYSTETLYQTITPTGRGSVLAGNGGFRSRLNSSAMSVEGAPALPVEVAPHLVKFAKDSSRYWYKATLSRDEAIALLLNAAPGTFVVRDSTTYKNAYGLVVRVAQPPPGGATGKRDELVRHFLIEPTTRGVRLKGCANEPVFTSLSALVYEHSINQLALPCLLRIPEQDLMPPLQEPTPAQRQLLTQGAACNVLWLFSCETESLTGEEAIRRAIRQLYASRPTLPAPTEVHFKVTQQGITLTDNTRKRFFRKHYVADDISFCAIDPDHRLWTMGEEAADGGGDVVGAMKKTIFAFVARRSASSKDNQCHVFCDLAVSQPASAIVSFVNKTLPTEKQRNYIL